MRFAIESAPFHEVSLDSMGREVAHLGFRYVNLWASARPLAAHVDVVQDDPRRVAQRLERWGLSAVGVTMYGKSQEEIAEGISFAAALGAQRVIFDCECNFPTFVDTFLPPLVHKAESQGVDICVENHLTVPFTYDFECGGHEQERWHEGVDTFAQIKRLVTEIDHPNLKICLAPPHLWVVGESILEVATFRLERKKLGYYYVWDISRSYHRGADGLNFGPGQEQLPRVTGTLDHGFLLKVLAAAGYNGYASLKCHGTADWSCEEVSRRLTQARNHVINVAGPGVFDQ